LKPKVKNKTSRMDEKILDDRGDNGRIIFEREQANKSLP
jgi:hypothetical protein